MTAFLQVFLPLLVAYATALWWCIERWNGPGAYFEHCWLLPPLQAYAIYARRAQWRTQPALPDWRGAWLLGPALLLHLCGALWTIDSLSAVSLVLAVPGAAWLAFGRARLQGLWPVLWLTALAVPLPLFVEGRLVFVLKEFAVGAGSALANLLGAAVVRDGASLLLQGGGGSLYVADACSGLRSLLALGTLGYVLAFLFGAPHWRRRLPLLLLAAPMALLANVLRIALLCLFARWFGTGFTEGRGHDLANAIEWLVAIGGLLGLDLALSRRLPPRPAAPPVLPRLAAPRSRTAMAVALWLLAAPLLGLSLWRPPAVTQQRAERLPVELAGYQLVGRTAEQAAEFAKGRPRWAFLLGTDDFVWRRYRDQDGHFVNLVALFHDTNWKSVHPPRLCIEGSNMDIEVDDLVPAPAFGAEATLGRIVARSRDDGWRYATLYRFGTVDWSTGSYAEFTWHHLPRALLRQNQSGFLLRVETPVQPGEPLATAEARCRAFLLALDGPARELLR